MTESFISTADLKKHYRMGETEVRALDGISLQIEQGSFTVIMGPSGSGKSTLLHLIGGLDWPTSGSISVDGEEIAAMDENALAAYRRNKLGFVFQSFNLVSSMTAEENVGFPLRFSGIKSSLRKERALEKLEEVGLSDRCNHKPTELSGEPRVLLLDEPFGALDAKVRKELRRWLRRLHDELHVTSIFVTHDQEEALEAADRVVVMNQGRIEQVGTPAEVYQHPVSPFVVDFLGDVNLFRFRIEHGKAYIGGLAFEVPHREDVREARLATLYIRPHQLEIRLEEGGAQQFRARVRHVNPAGPLVKVDLVAEWGDPVRVELSQERYRALGLKPGDRTSPSSAPAPSRSPCTPP